MHQPIPINYQNELHQDVRSNVHPPPTYYQMKLIEHIIAEFEKPKSPRIILNLAGALEPDNLFAYWDFNNWNPEEMNHDR